MSLKENSRRDFMKAFTALSYSRVLGANDRLRLGVVGFSERFRDALLPAFLKNSAAQNAEIVAVSDIWRLRREEGAALIAKKTDKPVAGVRNNDELYGRKDIDAVIVSTADFQHALHGVEAVRAGRDAYVEKPLAHNMADARAILNAVHETGRIVQVGTQRRSARNTKTAAERIRKGEFGDIVLVRFTSNCNQPFRWRRPELVSALKPEETDWGRWRMNASQEQWNPRKYIEFRLFWPYSSGIPDQWMVHQIDSLHMITGIARPRSVVAKGGVYHWKDGRTNPDTFTALFEYGPPNQPSRGFQVIFTSCMANSSEGGNDTYYFNGGMLDMDAGEITSEGGLTEKYAKAAGMKPNLLPKTPLLSKGGDKDDAVAAHMKNWLECVRSRKAPVADVTAGYNHSIALSMAVAALHSGKTATFDEARQEVAV